MKKLFLLLILYSFFGFAQKPLLKNFSSLDEKFQKKFKVNNDVFEGAVFIYEKKSYGQNIRIKPYLVIKDNQVFYRVKLMYDGYDWLNFSNYKFLVNDQVLEIPIGETRKEISYKFSAVENTDILLSDSEIEIFHKIGSAKTPIKYRISGEKFVDLKLYENQYIKDLTDLYNLLTN